MSNKIVSAKFSWNKQTKQLLENAPDKIMYAIATQTLDKTVPIIPKSTKKNGGTMRVSTRSYGARKATKLGYHLCSKTNYAVYPYEMNDSTTNWSTPGTHSKWFDRTWDEQHETIIKSAIDKNKL